MSSHSREEVGQIFEHMSPAVYGALCLHEQESESYDITTDVDYLHYSVIAKIQAVDWESIGIPDITTANEDQAVPIRTAREKATHLATLAKDDAMEILTIVKRAAPDLTIPAEVSLTDLLLASAPNLLRTAKLPDTKSIDLLHAVRLTQTAFKDIEVAYINDITYDVASNPIQLKRDNNVYRLDWSDAIIEYIDAHAQPFSGCPARKQVVETVDGQKITLLHYFWQRMILAQTSANTNSSVIPA